jgi:hypothetical protein
MVEGQDKEIDYQKYPQKENVQILWHDNWYDGELMGMCQIDRTPYYYWMVDQNSDSTQPWWRRYALIQLPPDVLKLEFEKEALWEENPTEYHKKYPDRPRYDQLYPIVGWFEL